MPDIAEVHGQVAEVADLPAAEFEGRIFRVTGTDPGLYRDNGASWDQVSSMGGGGGLTNPMTAADSIIVGDSGGPGDPAELVKGGNNTIFGVAPDGTLGYRSVSKGFTRRLEDPGSSGWTSVNGSGAFYADGMWIVSMPQASSDSLHARVKAATAGTNRQYFGFIVPGWTPEGDIEAGICLNDSASGGFVSLTIGFDNSGQLPCTRVTYWTDANTIASVESQIATFPGPMGLFIVETATTRTYYMTPLMDGSAATEVWSDNISDHLAVRADRVGFCWNPKYTGGGPRSISFAMPHWHMD
jgi:hypothetical protein